MRSGPIGKHRFDFPSCQALDVMLKGLVTEQVMKDGILLVSCLRRDKPRKNIMNFVCCVHMSIIIYDEEIQYKEQKQYIYIYMVIGSIRQDISLSYLYHSMLLAFPYNLYHARNNQLLTSRTRTRSFRSPDSSCLTNSSIL